MLKKLHNRLAITFTSVLGAVLLVVLSILLYYSLTSHKEQSFDNYYSQVHRTVSKCIAIAGSGATGYTGYVQGMQTDEPYIAVVQSDNSSTLYAAVTSEAQAAGTLTGAVQSKQADVYAADEAETVVEFAQTWQPKASGEVLIQKAKEHAPSYERVSLTQYPEIYDYTISRAVVDDDGAESQVSVYVMMEEDLTLGLPIMVGQESEFKLDGTKYRAYYTELEMPEEQTIITQTQNGGLLISYESKAYNIAVLEDLTKYNRSVVLIVLAYFGAFAAGVAVLFVASRFFAKQLLRSTEEGLNREKQFIASASHELRTPLSVIRASLSAAESSESEDEAKKYRVTADRQAERMGRLLDDLLLASTDSSSWNLQMAEAEMDTLLIETVDAFTPAATKKSISLKLDLPEDTLPRVNADKDRLAQILCILLDNAIEYSSKNTSVVVNAQQKKNKVVVQVSDEAGGIPDDEKNVVFEAGARGSTRQSGQKGAAKKHFGLGLSIAEQLARLHEGSLKHSNNENGGSTFTLEIPVKEK